MARAFSPFDLLHHFHKNKGMFTNREGVRFEMMSEDCFLVSASVRIPVELTFTPPMRLEIKHYGLYELLNDYRIGSLQFIKQKLSRAEMYELYYTLGRGQLIVTLTDYLECPRSIPVELYFEHLPDRHDKTKIYAPFLNYFEEVAEGFYEEQQYVDYIQKHRHLFEWLLSNKSKIQFCKNLGADECRN